MDTYLKDRQELIAAERAVRSGSARTQAASDIERQADRIVREIRAREAKAIWHSEHEDYSAIFRSNDPLYLNECEV
jgi:uncharacterized protein Yka (UPF0111/DUF47 family)